MLELLKNDKNVSEQATNFSLNNYSTLINASREYHSKYYN